MENNRKIYTLSDLGKSLRSVIERAYSSTYWIKAEIAKLNYYPRSGHCYPELVEKTGNLVLAQMRAMIWAADYSRINKQFLDVTGDSLKEGMSILFRASVNYHPVYGFSLHIHEIEPAFTLGEMALEKTATITRLKKEGIFHKNKELVLPLLPKRVAVISVETSKGYHDFLNIIKSKNEQYHIWHFLFPSVLQGEKAVEGIISQLRIIKKLTSRFDIVALIRGGGGDIGLSCYDDYKLAAEVADFPLPVITGIGHSTNETVAEMVSWSNKITPTDVAYFIFEKFIDFENRIDNCARSVKSDGAAFVNREQKKLGFLSAGLVQSANHLTNRHNVFINSAAGLLVQETKNLLTTGKQKVNNLSMQVLATPKQIMFKEICDMDNRIFCFKAAVKTKLVNESNHIAVLENKTRLLDPQNILKRGYSITRVGDKVIRDASELKKGDIIKTRFYKGEITSEVKK
ncbi:MAG: exodeoxyribonuclease VII large subunit [Bacteroidales bacterium]